MNSRIMWRRKTFCKNPATKEDIAYFIGNLSPEYRSEYPVFMEALYESIYKFIYKIAHKYKVTCPGEEVNDLANRCWERILCKLHQFNPKYSLTTWCWYVSTSTLNKYYNKYRKYNELFTELDDGLDEERVENESQSSHVLKYEIRQAVFELMEGYPDKKEVIRNMFGDINNGEEISSKVNLAGTARQCGETESSVSTFYHKVVKPHFVCKFQEVYDGR